jgi:hypothetical protein
MLYFRACPRCKTGTVELASDMHGWYLTCINCGFHRAGDRLRQFATSKAAIASGTVRPVPRNGHAPVQKAAAAS